MTIRTLYRYEDPNGRGTVRMVRRAAAPELVVILDVPGDHVAWAPFYGIQTAASVFATIADRFIADAPVSLKEMLQ